MKTLRIVLLTLIISFFVSAIGIFIILKYVITPEKIRNYLDVYIEKSVNDKFSKAGSGAIDEIYSSTYKNYKSNSNYVGDEFEDLRTLEKLSDIKQFKDPKLLEKLTNLTDIGDIKLLDNIGDINYLSSQLSGTINMKMDLLKYKIKNFISRKDFKIDFKILFPNLKELIRQVSKDTYMNIFMDALFTNNEETETI